MEFADLLTEYWAVIGGAVALITSYADLKAQNVAQERRIKILEEEQKALNPILLEIRTKLASIESTLQALIREGQRK